MSGAIAAAGIPTIASVEVEPVVVNGNLVDRKIMVVLSCRHVKFVGIALDAPLPVVGESSRCLACHCPGQKHEVAA